MKSHNRLNSKDEQVLYPMHFPPNGEGIPPIDASGNLCDTTFIISGGMTTILLLSHYTGGDVSHVK